MTFARASDCVALPCRVAFCKLRHSQNESPNTAMPRCLTHILTLPATLWLAGCSPAPRSEPVNTAPAPFTADVSTLLDLMTDPMTLPDLRIPGGGLLSSYDVTGGNNDWSSTMVAAGNNWVTLADLKGPGYVSRIWITGWSDYAQPVEFIFDDEVTPRVALTMNELFGHVFPFEGPFARQENFCEYLTVPIPYEKRLVIRTKALKPAAKPYFQINYTALPEGSKAVSFPRSWSSGEKQAWRRAAEILRRGGVAPPGKPLQTQAVELKPGESRRLSPTRSPGVIREVRITPAAGQVFSSAQWSDLLTGLRIGIGWNGQGESVNLSAAQFFGQPARLTAYSSKAHAFDGNALICRLPMPFRQAEFRLFNEGKSLLEFEMHFDVESMTELPAHLGFLCAVAHSSLPRDVGPMHTILRTRGRGKYAGVFLSVDSSRLNNWWGLEGDEHIRWDDAYQPQWKGTGVEDHFNGGWYYRRVLAEYFSGLLTRMQFQAVQYRWFSLEAPAFLTSLDVQLERGGENEAAIGVDSVAWYYLAAPETTAPKTPATSLAFATFELSNPAILTQHLVEMETLGDYDGCRRLLALIGARQGMILPPDITGFLDKLYQARRAGWAEVFGSAPSQPPGNDLPSEWTSAFDHLSWLQASATNALLTVAAGTPVQVWYGGRMLGSAGPTVGVFRVSAPMKEEVLAVVASRNSTPDFLHLRLESAGRVWMSGDHWKYSATPEAGWETAGYDDRSWADHADNWLSVATPPATPTPWIDLYSNAGNIARPVPAGATSMVHRIVLRPGDGSPLR